MKISLGEDNSNKNKFISFNIIIKIWLKLLISIWGEPNMSILRLLFMLYFEYIFDITILYFSNFLFIKYFERSNIIELISCFILLN